MKAFCRTCGAYRNVKLGVALSRLACTDGADRNKTCGGPLVSETVMAKAAGLRRGRSNEVTYLPRVERVKLLAEYEARKQPLLDHFDATRTTRVETRDGVEYTVTELPDQEIPAERDSKSHYHFAEVGRPGHVRPRQGGAAAPRKKRG